MRLVEVEIDSVRRESRRGCAGNGTDASILRAVALGTSALCVSERMMKVLPRS